MKRRIAVLLVALYARAFVLLAANVARELPARLVYVLEADHGLQKDCVGKVHLRYPDGADYVRPCASVCLLERAVTVRTQLALDRVTRRQNASATQPLAFGYVGHAVALLMHGQVAHVTKENGVAVQAFAVEANATQSVIVRERVVGVN